MKKDKTSMATSTDEFERRFDDGEDVHDMLDMSKARIIHHGETWSSQSSLE